MSFNIYGCKFICKWTKNKCVLNQKWGVKFFRYPFFSNEKVPALLAAAMSGNAVQTKSLNDDLTLDLDNLPPFVPDLQRSTSSDLSSTTSSSTLSSTKFKELPYTPESLPDVTFVQHKNRDGGYFLPRRTRPVPAPEEKINQTLAWKPVPSNAFDISGLLAKGQSTDSEAEADDNWGFLSCVPSYSSSYPFLILRLNFFFSLVYVPHILT